MGLLDWQAESLSRFPDASATAIDDFVGEIIASRSVPTRQSNRALYDRLTISRKDGHAELLRGLSGAAQSPALAAAADLPD